MLDLLDGLPVTPGEVHLLVGLLTLYLVLLLLQMGRPLFVVVLVVVVELAIRNPTTQATLKDLLYMALPERADRPERLQRGRATTTKEI